MKSISFIGRESGDGECFRWEISSDARRLIIGDEAFNEELIEQEEISSELGHPNPAPAAYIYPGEVLTVMGCKDDKKYRFTIQAEEVE